MFIENPGQVQDRLNELYKGWQPVAEDAKAVKSLFPDRKQPGESKVAEALKDTGEVHYDAMTERLKPRMSSFESTRAS